MQAPIAILLIAASLVLVAEVLMAAVAGLLVFQPGVDWFAHLTQRGRELLPYTLFLVSALLVIMITAAFRSG